jgi:ferredoxin-NADP reductase
MEKELVEGNSVWIKLPYGDFVIDNTEKVVLIAGGTGITAFSAFIEGLKPESNQNVYLFYGARNESLLVYKEMLAKVAKAVPNFHLQYFVESAPQRTAINGFLPVIGKLDIQRIMGKIENPMTAVYFLSGPPLMLSRFSNDLNSLGISTKQIRIDAWE